MDGVERVMVLGIFAVIVAILSIAAWGVSSDSGGVVLDVAGGGVSSKADPVVSSDPKLLPRGADDQLASAKDDRTQRPGGLADDDEGSDAERRGPRGGKAGRSTDPNDPLAGAGGAGRPAMPSLSSSTPVLGGRKPEILDPPAAEPTVVEPKAGKPGVAAKTPAVVEYTVVNGDTMWSLVRRFFGEGDNKAQMQYVQQMNPGLDVAKIRVGDVLRVPATPPEELQSKPVAQSVKPGTKLYTIKAGETLSGIAKAQLGADKRWRDIYDLNRDTIADPADIHPGMTILVPVK